jgi:uncharacterized membrane protein YebE (DUF533 family)
MAEADNPILQVIRVWAAMSWADGVISADESRLMKKFIAAARLEEADKQRALGMLEHRVGHDATDLQSVSQGARKGIYQAAVRVAAVDGIVAAERAFLDGLREALQLDVETCRELEADVPQRPGR